MYLQCLRLYQMIGISHFQGVRRSLIKIARKSPYFNRAMDRAYLISVINPFTCLTHAIFLIETTLSFGCANNLTYKP